MQAKKMNAPIITLETISPQLAAEWLKGNTTNRRLVYNHIERMSGEMKEGQWKVTGDTIKFNGDRLLDGQHRLEAVVRSGVTIQSFVARSVDTDTFSAMDTGRSRAGGDVLSAFGYRNVFITSAAARMVWWFEHRIARLDGAVTNATILATMKKHPDLSVIISEASAHRFAKNGGTCATLYWIYKCQPSKADDFIDQFLKGVELKQSNPVHLVRERLINDPSLRATKKGRRSMVAMIFRCWEAWLNEKPMTLVKASHMSGEYFPWPRGGPYLV